MRDNLSILQRERNTLLNEWMYAKGNEKVRLLVRIMDIDEQLEVDKRKSSHSQQKVG